MSLRNLPSKITEVGRPLNILELDKNWNRDKISSKISSFCAMKRAELWWCGSMPQFIYRTKWDQVKRCQGLADELVNLMTCPWDNWPQMCNERTNDWKEICWAEKKGSLVISYSHSVRRKEFTLINDNN